MIENKIDQVEVRGLGRWLKLFFVVSLLFFFPGCGGGGGSDSGPTWTIMVYLDGDNNLETEALNDFNEMELARFSSRTKVVVLFDRSDKVGGGYTTAQGGWSDTRLYEILPDSNSAAISSKRLEDPDGLGITLDGTRELNMGSGETLKRFVAFGKQAYPAEKTALIVWNHGSGWVPPPADGEPWVTRAVAYDGESKNDALTMVEIAGALEGQSVDFLGFDACLMAEAEVAWELKDSASYMLASQGLEPSAGWNYTAFLNDFTNLSDEGKTPVGLAGAIAKSYMADTYSGIPLTLSLFDLKGLSPLMDAINDLGTTITESGAGKDSVTRARSDAASYNDKMVVDLLHFAKALKGADDVADVTDALSKAIVRNWAQQEEAACGVSLYFPIFGFNDGYFEDYTSALTAFSKGSSWDEALLSYKEDCRYWYVETFGPTSLSVLPDTFIRLYAPNGSSAYAENDNKPGTSVTFLSGLKVPVASGSTYHVKITQKDQGVFIPSTQKTGYYVYASETQVAYPDGDFPITDPEESQEDDTAQQAKSLTPGIPMPGFISAGDTDWVRFAVP